MPSRIPLLGKGGGGAIVVSPPPILRPSLLSLSLLTIYISIPLPPPLHLHIPPLPPISGSLCSRSRGSVDLSQNKEKSGRVVHQPTNLRGSKREKEKEKVASI